MIIGLLQEVKGGPVALFLKTTTRVDLGSQVSTYITPHRKGNQIDELWASGKSQNLHNKLKFKRPYVFKIYIYI